jgi:hypothetical protein
MVNSSLFNTGTWSQYTSYAPLDIVYYIGATYIALIANVNQVPPNATYWTLFSSAGAQGGGASPSNPAYTDQVFFVNSNIVQTNVTLPANDNAGVFGPLTISASATVTIPSTTVLTIV